MATISQLNIGGTAYDIRDNSKLPLSGGTITGPIQFVSPGLQLNWTAGGENIILQLNNAVTYGSRYFEGEPDKWTFSASGNANTPASADLCINGGGNGTVTIRGKKIATEAAYAYNNSWNISTSSGELSTSLSITTHGRPVFIAFSWDMQSGWCTGAVYRGTTQLKARTTVGDGSANNCGIITYLDVVAAGTYTYNFYLKSGSGTIQYNESNLYGQELPSLCIFEI